MDEIRNTILMVETLKADKHFDQAISLLQKTLVKYSLLYVSLASQNPPIFFGVNKYDSGSNLDKSGKSLNKISGIIFVLNELFFALNCSVLFFISTKIYRYAPTKYGVLLF